MTVCAIVGATVGCGSAVFVCQSDDQCGGAGVCDDGGRCNFPAEDCPSGLRYGHDGGPNAGECLPEGAVSTGTTGQAVTSTSGGSTEGTIGSSTTLTTTSGTITTSGSPTSTSGITSDSDGSSTGASSMFCDPTAESLVLCLEFSDPTSSPIPDGSAYGNDAEAEGLASVDSPYGTAAGFGPGARVTVAAADSINLLPDVTVEAWVRVDLLPPTNTRMGVLDKQYEYSIFILPDGNVQCGGIMGAQGGAIAADDWVFVACVRDDVGWHVYLDGDLVASGGLGNTTTSPGDIFIGANAPDLTDPLQGGLYGVRVWAAALDAATLAEHVLPAG